MYASQVSSLRVDGNPFPPRVAGMSAAHKVWVYCDTVMTARSLPHDLIFGEVANEAAAAPQFALHPQLGVVTLQHVFDDGESEPGAASLTRTADVHPIKALGETRNVMGGDALAGILHFEVGAVGIGIPTQRDAAALRRVTHRIRNKIDEGAA